MSWAYCDAHPHDSRRCEIEANGQDGEKAMPGDALQHWHDAIGVLGLALLAASYMSSDLKKFRLFSVAAFVVGALYFILVPEGSNWVGVGAMAIYAVINLVLFSRAAKAKRLGQAAPKQTVDPAV